MEVSSNSSVSSGMSPNLVEGFQVNLDLVEIARKLIQNGWDGKSMESFNSDTSDYMGFGVRFKKMEFGEIQKFVSDNLHLFKSSNRSSNSFDSMPISNPVHNIQNSSNAVVGTGQLQKIDPPAYLEEMFTHGYHHLHRHLVEMRSLSNRLDRLAKIEKMTFLEISRIVLETREAVIRKVNSDMPAERKNILFLLGDTGSGKSTTLCFLRGDKMLLKDFLYFPEGNSLAVGHQETTSCTFLPPTEMIKDIVMVDFPGFDDTNGPLIALGMELALKVLIKEYCPSILVLVSVTNVDGRFVSIANLGMKLDRILEDKRNCLLGITKYSKDPDYVKLTFIEENQKKEQVLQSPEELGMQETIEILQRLNDPGLNSVIEEKKIELKQLRDKRFRLSLHPLPETPDKVACRRNILEREQELLKQTGLSHILRFTDLGDAQHLEICLQTLSTNNLLIHVRSSQILDPDHRKLLDQCFENDLLRTIESDNGYALSTIQDLDEFKTKVMKSSLINAILSEACPEISQLLHSPEIDPLIVYEYDQRILNESLTKIRKLIVMGFDVRSIEEFLNEMSRQHRANDAQVKQFCHKLQELRHYILGLLGTRPENITDENSVWEKTRKIYQTAHCSIGEYLSLPKWIKVVFHVSDRIFNALLYFSKIKEESYTLQIPKDTMDEFCESLNQLFSILKGLKEIEFVIERKKEG